MHEFTVVGGPVEKRADITLQCVGKSFFVAAALLLQRSSTLYFQPAGFHFNALAPACPQTAPLWYRAGRAS